MLYENQTFEEQVRQLQDERHRRENCESQSNQLHGEYIYVGFRVWCNAFNDGNGKTDPKVFAKWLKKENIELTFWQRKHLAEKYFGYKYEYKHDKQEWKITKIKAQTLDKTIKN